MIEHPEAGRVDPIAGDVHAIWRDSHERCGAGKIKAALERRGVTASRRRIVNIMKRRGMTSAYARRTFKPHKTRVNEARLANILDREFDGYEPRTHLASDLTYVRVGGKWAYACLLIDLANSVFCQVVIGQCGVSFPSEKAVGFSPVRNWPVIARVLLFHCIRA